MTRREFDALRGHKIEEGIMARRGDIVHGLHDALIGLRAGDGGDAGIGGENLLRFGTHAAGDDDFAVLGHGGTDCVERLGLGAIEKAAGIDDDGVGTLMGFGEFIAFGAQLRDDPFAVDERFRASEGNKRDFGCCLSHLFHSYVVARTSKPVDPEQQ